MRKYITATALIILWSALLPSKADAIFMTGNDLYPKCENKEVACITYILGAVDAQEAFDEMVPAGNQPSRTKYVCKPSNVNGGQILAVVMKWMQDRPSERHWPAAIIIRNAMVAAFPCR